MSDPLYLAKSEDGYPALLPQMANRHGLITGATGTGKTVSLQSIAELLYGMVRKMVEDITGKDGLKYFPYIMCLFLFIAFANMLGLLPKAFTVTSPDCRDQLSIVFDKPDFSSERVQVLISPAAPTSSVTDYRFDFGLTSFAFPFTDNAGLPSGNRFAFFIKDVSELDDSGTSKIMRVGLRWFPQNYYPPTERPTDYKEFRRALGSTGQ